MDKDNFSAFDLQFVLSQVGGDRELLKEVIAIYAEGYPKKLKALRESIEKKDAGGIECVAHAIRGSAALFAADPLPSRRPCVWNRSAGAEICAKLKTLIPRLRMNSSGSRKNLLK